MNLTLISYQEATDSYTDRWGDSRGGIPSSLEIWPSTHPDLIGKHWAEMEKKLKDTGGEYPEFTLLVDGIDIDEIEDDSINDMLMQILAVKEERRKTLDEESEAAHQAWLATEQIRKASLAAAQMRREVEFEQRLYLDLKKKYGGGW